MLAMQLSVLLAASIWVLVFILRGSLLTGCLAVVVATTCFSRYFLSIDVGPLTLSIDRVLLVVLLAGYLVQRSMAKTDQKPLLLSEYFLLALVGWLTISTFTHDYTRTFGTTAAPYWRLLAGYWMPLVLYWVVRQAPLSERVLKGAQWSLVLFGVYLGLTGLLETTGQWWAVFPRYIADPNQGIHFGRARGPMLSSVPYGTYVAVCLLAVWTCWQGASQRQKIALFLILPLLLAAAYLSYTRSVWLGIVIASLVVAGMTLRGRHRTVALSSALAAGLLIAALFGNQIMYLERDHSGTVSARSAASRAAFAYVSWEMFQDHPLDGVGFGHFPQEKLRYLTDQNTPLNLEHVRPFVSHNTLLTLLAEVGAIGLFLFCATVFAWVRSALVMWRDPQMPGWVRDHAVMSLGAISIWICQMAFHEVTYTPLVNYLIFFMAGITSSLHAMAIQAARRPEATDATDLSSYAVVGTT